VQTAQAGGEKVRERKKRRKGASGERRERKKKGGGQKNRSKACMNTWSSGNVYSKRMERRGKEEGSGGVLKEKREKGKKKEPYGTQCVYDSFIHHATGPASFIGWEREGKKRERKEKNKPRIRSQKRRGRSLWSGALIPFCIRP